MPEKKGLVTFQGNPLTLMGEPVKEGDKAPSFTVLDTGLNPVSLDDFSGKVLIVIAVPSLDTDVCDMEAKRFNEEAGKLGSNVKVVTISMDLPFAQGRWVEENNVTNLSTYSDHKDASFGQAYGILIKELRLLARTVFIIDEDKKIRYVQLVKEMTEEPDYTDVLNTVQNIL